MKAYIAFSVLTLFCLTTPVFAVDTTNDPNSTHYLAERPGGCPEGPPCPGLHAKGQCLEKGTVSDVGDFPLCNEGEKSDIGVFPGPENGAGPAQ
jgi:hypothetical protein